MLHHLSLNLVTLVIDPSSPDHLLAGTAQGDLLSLTVNKQHRLDSQVIRVGEEEEEEMVQDLEEMDLDMDVQMQQKDKSPDDPVVIMAMDSKGLLSIAR